MILEHALLHVTAPDSEQFEADFEQASKIIASMPGFINLQLNHSIETPGLYLLLVQWESVEAHQVGFRQSSEYEQWKELLHHYYSPFPTVEHFDNVLTVNAPAAAPTA